MLRFLCLLALVVVTVPAHAEEPVSLPLIMQHPDWIGRAPEGPYWADDGKSVLYQRKREGSEVRDLFRVDATGNHTELLTPAAMAEASTGSGEFSANGRHKVFARQGDLFWKDVRSGRVRQLTQTHVSESDPHFLRGDEEIWFRRDGQIYIRSLEDGTERQPAELLAEKDPDEAPEPELDYLQEQQRALFAIVRQWDRNDEEREARDDELAAADPYRAAPAWYLGDGVEIGSSSLSPNGRWVLVRLSDKNRDSGQRDEMPNYISDDGYVSSRSVRPKVGTGEPDGEDYALLDLDTRERVDLDLSGLPDIAVDRLAEIRANTAAWRAERDGEEPPEDEESESEEEEASPRPVAAWGEEWHPDGDQVLLQLFSDDSKDRWIVKIDAPSGTVETVHHLHDPAWINWRYNEMGWVPGSDDVYYLSEESGYSRLYLVSDGTTHALTDDGATASAVEPTRDGKWLYYRSNPDHPGVYEIYRVSTGNHRTEQITSLGGVNDADLSPDGKRLLVRHSEIDRHVELYVVDAKANGKARAVTQTVSEDFANQDWVIPEIVEIPGRHGRPIYSKFYRPAEGLAPGSPAVIFVHGAGYTQNAHKGWAYYFREFMFHTLLTQHGYAVLDMDYRASAGYGRDWRTAIYRQMGTPELDDLQDGIDWMAQEHGVDPSRVGVYGGSYGGFITLMALFTRPDMFQCGAALRPVTDWAHYNHGYTSNILNTPTDDNESFYRSSPIEHAEGLTKPLLMMHGMQDDNVVFQDTVRLAQRLIELEKEDWEVALYPIEPHGFREPSSWLDEYRRIFKLMEMHLK